MTMMPKNLPRLLTFLLLALFGVATVAASEPDGRVVFSDAIEVVDSLVPVPAGHAVRVRFPVGELEITAAEVDSVKTALEVRCDRLSPALCDKYSRRLRLAADVRDGVVEVRLVGLPKWKLRKLRLDGAVTVPSRAPLEVEVGIGDVDIRAGERDLAVRMGIGDLTVHAAPERVHSVRAATRIGDAAVRGARQAEGRRRLLLGAVLDWTGGGGGIDIALALRIGDASVVLE
jgi:hypothetical protein